MSKSLKITVAALGCVVVILMLVELVFPFDKNLDEYQARWESAASEALGMEVHIEGPFKVDFLPTLRMVFSRLRVRYQGVNVLKARQGAIAFNFLALFGGEPRVTKLTLLSPTIFLELYRDGRFSIEIPMAEVAATRMADLPLISITDAELHYVDSLRGVNLKAVECDGELSAGFVMSSVYVAGLTCSQVRVNSLVVSDLQLTARRRDRVLRIDPVTMHIFGADASATVQVEYLDTGPDYRIDYAMPRFGIEPLFQELLPDGASAQGLMDLSVNLTMRGRTAGEMKQTMNGQILMRGDSLTLYGLDLDQLLARVESSQNFNLVDVGAFVFAGPVGLMITKGRDFASLFGDAGASSKIGKLVANWRLEKGIARAVDVAMATDENRIALSGGIDLASEDFDQMAIAVLDENGCAKVQQELSGNFDNPTVGTPNVFEALAGPAVSLINKGRNLFGSQCEVFYSGSVTPR